MRAIKYWLGSLPLFILYAQSVFAADEVVLTSGDHLMGEVTEVSKEYIVIDTVFAKQLKINHELISELKTDSEVKIVFNDGRIVEAMLLKSENDPLTYEQNSEQLTLDIAEIAQDPKESIALLGSHQGKVKYSGNLDIGLSRTSGNEDDEDYHGGMMLQARTDNNRYTLEATKTIEKNDGDKTQDETYGSLQWDHFINQKWYGFTSVSFEKDLEELLNLRSTYSLGSGYEFFDQDDLKMKAEIGLAYVDEDFEDDADNHYMGWRWAFDYEQAWVKWLGVFHSHEGFFSFENSEDINVRSSTGLKFPLNDHINAKLEANIDWNRSPAEGTTGTDKEYIFTLGYEF